MISNIFVFIYIFAFLVASNPLINSFIPSSFSVLFLLLLCAFQFTFSYRSFFKYRIFVYISFLLLPLFVSLLVADFSPGNLPGFYAFKTIGYFLASSICLLNFDKLAFTSILRWLRIYLVVQLIGAFISLICSIIFGPLVLFSVTIPGYRTLDFIPFTFSDSKYLIFFRPSGFFDEPGSFAFFIICTVASLSILEKRKNNLRLNLILASGIITTSTGFIVSIVPVFASFFYRLLSSLKVKFGYLFVSLIFSILVFVASISGFFSPIYTRIIGLIFNPILYSSGRVPSALNSLNHIFYSNQNLLFANIECYKNPFSCDYLNFNFFYYFVKDGLVGSLSSICILLIFTIYSFRKRNPYVLCVPIFLLQKTNMFSTWPSFSLSILLILVFLDMGLSSPITSEGSI